MSGLYTDPDRPQFTSAHATIVGLAWSRGGCQVTLDVWHPRWKGVGCWGRSRGYEPVDSMASAVNQPRSTSSSYSALA